MTTLTKTRAALQRARMWLHDITNPDMNDSGYVRPLSSADTRSQPNSAYVRVVPSDRYRPVATARNHVRYPTD